MNCCFGSESGGYGQGMVASIKSAVERGGLFGPKLTALVAFLKGVCHASYATVRKFLRDVVKLPVSRGYLAKVIAKVSFSPCWNHSHKQRRS